MISKVVFYTVYIVILGIIGAVAYFLVSILVRFIPEQFKELPLVAVFGLVVFVYILALVVHEGGHVISILRNKISLRAVKIQIFLFIKIDGKWKLRFVFSDGLDGIAVPDMPLIRNEEDFLKMQKAFAKILIAGPLATIYGWVFVFVISLVILFRSSDPIIQSAAFAISSSFSVISLFTFLILFVKDEHSVNDIPGFQLIKKDAFFAAYLFYQYIFFSSSPEKLRDESCYLKAKLIEELQIKLSQKDVHMYTINAIDILLMEYLAGIVKEMPEVVEGYLDFLLNDSEALTKLHKSGDGAYACFHIVQFLYMNDSTRHSATELYDRLKTSLKPITPVIDYFIRQTDHIIGLEDHSEFLKNRKNMRTSQIHSFTKHFDGCFVDEIRIIENITNKISTRINAPDYRDE